MTGVPHMPGGTPTPGRGSEGAGTVMVLVLYGLALIVSVTLVVRGQHELGIGGILLVLTLAPIAFALTSVARGRERRRMLHLLDEITRTLQTVADGAVLSDDARRIVNRQHEREVLQRAIEEDIAAQNWDAAMILIRELADRFGFRSEAETMRARVEDARRQSRDVQITEAIGYLEGLIVQRRWDDAFADAARIQRLYPDAEIVKSLRDHVTKARGEVRRELEERFVQAANEERSDEAMRVMKELDPYLTAAEAEPLREQARRVIGKARDAMGAQFRSAVQDRRWTDAARLGEAIVAQFPNTTMAKEVTEMLAGVRAKANAG